jgi:sugar lactone lactonase YvrE
MDLKDPARIIGVFKSPEHSLKDSEQIKAFFEKFPYLNQILAVSPDGSIAVSGTHLYNTADFTIIGELPLPTTSVAFHPDNKTLYLGDAINRQVVGINYREMKDAQE